MAGATIRLQTNIPLSGTVTYCDFVKSNKEGYSDQIALRGAWDGAGEGRVYLPLALENDFRNINLIGQRSSNGNYPLLIAQARIKLLKVEQGTTKRTTVELISCSPQSEGKQPPATNSTPPALYGAGTAASPPDNRQPSVNPAPTPVTVEDLEETLQECLMAATAIWEAAGVKAVDTSDAIAASAHTLYISRTQRGMYAKAQPETVPFA